MTLESINAFIAKDNIYRRLERHTNVIQCSECIQHQTLHRVNTDSKTTNKRQRNFPLLMHISFCHTLLYTMSVDYDRIAVRQLEPLNKSSTCVSFLMKFLSSSILLHMASNSENYIQEFSCRVSGYQVIDATLTCFGDHTSHSEDPWRPRIVDRSCIGCSCTGSAT